MFLNICFSAFLFNFKFWHNFFPEFKKIEKLENILNMISKKSLQKVVKKRDENTLKYDFFFDNIDKDFKKYIENIISKYNKSLKWINFIKPILVYRLKDLYVTIENSKIILDNDLFFEKIFFSVSQKLFQIMYKTLILELRIAKNENLLNGKTPEERGYYFNDVLLNKKNYLNELYSSYPELIRIIDLQVINFINYLNELLKNTENEKCNLEKAFTNNKSIGYLCDIELGKGDYHNKGKSVTKLTFDSRVTLIYKPHKFDLEHAFCKFIKWFNTLNINEVYTLECCKVHSCNDCGWMEYVDFSPCLTKDDVKKFYVRVGQLLCILYTLRANDFHYENLIAKGDQPILIDLETILGQGRFCYNIKTCTAEQNAANLINESVTKISLLPTKIFNLKNNKSVSIGGLNLIEGQELPFTSFYIENIITDEVQVVEKYVKTGKTFNNPVLNDEIINSGNYVFDIIFGFKQTYRWIIENRKKYLEKIKEIFSNCQYRLILKPTNTYNQILDTSFHPDLLHNGVDRFVYLHRLGLLLEKNKKITKQRKLTKLELIDLMNGDMPYFYSSATDKSLFDGDKNKVKNFYSKSTIDNIIKHIDTMSLKDLDWQVFFIEVSYNKCNKPKINLSNSTINLDIKRKDKLISSATDIANVILSRGIYGTFENKVNLTFIEKASENEISIGGASFTKDGLFDGNAGIALYFAVLSQYTNDESFKNIALTSLSKIITILEKKYTNEVYSKIDAQNGLTGILYTVLKISKILNNNYLYNLSYERLDYLLHILQQKSIDKMVDIKFDIISILDVFKRETEDIKIKQEIMNFCNDKFSNEDMNKFFNEKIQNKQIKTDRLADNFDLKILSNGKLGLSKGLAGVGLNLLRLYDSSIPDFLNFD